MGYYTTILLTEYIHKILICSTGMSNDEKDKVNRDYRLECITGGI